MIVAQLLRSLFVYFAFSWIARGEQPHRVAAIQAAIVLFFATFLSRRRADRSAWFADICIEWSLLPLLLGVAVVLEPLEPWTALCSRTLFYTMTLAAARLGVQPLRSSTRARGPAWRARKRMLDVILALLLLPVVAPAVLILAAVIAIVDRQSPFFIQRRLTQFRRPFRLYKLRTMRTPADASTPPPWTAVHDPRITRLGHVLRQLHLDKLPQLMNILEGSLSFVGPRPERPEYAQVFAKQLPMYHDRYHVPGGVTGWAQINGFAGNTSIRQRLEHDLAYCQKPTLKSDLRILVLTVVRCFAPKHVPVVDYSPDRDDEIP